MKPGWKTTEFWMSLLAVVVTYLMSTDMVVEGGIVSKALMAVAAVLAALGYSLSRAYVKREEVRKNGG